jgi:hypothetical protein
VKAEDKVDWKVAKCTKPYTFVCHGPTHGYDPKDVCCKPCRFNTVAWYKNKKEAV